MSDSVSAEEEFEPTLRNVIESTTLKWVFVGGKGGVGKTTTSSSLAIELAKTRESVLLLSTDPAHNISDAFCQKFSNKPSLVQGFENLYAMEIDATFEDSVEFKIEKNDPMKKMLGEMMKALPGIDEALSFAELMQSVQSMTYSVIVFDTAPTGHTLRLLGFPELLEKGFRTLSSPSNPLGGALSMLSMGSENDIAGKLGGIRAVTTSVREIFADPLRCTFVSVCIPEFLSVYETERLIQSLAEYSIDTRNIVVNNVLVPDECSDCKMCKARRKMQAKYLQQVEDLYGFDFHITIVPLQLEEVRGHESLRSFAEHLKTPTRLADVCLST